MKRFGKLVDGIKAIVEVCLVETRRANRFNGTTPTAASGVAPIKAGDDTVDGIAD